MTAIEIIQKSLDTHIDWLAYLEANPESLELEAYRNIGNIPHHRQCIRRYNEAITEITETLRQRDELLDKCKKALPFITHLVVRDNVDAVCVLRTDLIDLIANATEEK